MRNRLVTSFIILLFTPSLIFSQTTIAKEDYDRAVGFLWSNVNNKKAFNLYITPNWFPDSTGLWFVHWAEKQKKYLKITFHDLEISPLFDHDLLAGILSDSLETEIKATDLPINQIKYIDAENLSFKAKGKEYTLNLEDHSLSLTEKEEDNPNESASKDGKWIAYSKDYNLYIKSTVTDEVRQFSTAGKKGYEYASWYGWADIMEGEGGERPERFGVNWSPDSKWIFANIVDLRFADKMYLLDWSVDSLYRPRLLSYYRGSPGDTTMIHLIPVFFNVETGEEIHPDLPRNTHVNNVSIRWSKEPGKVFAFFSTRGYQNIFIYSLDLKTNKLEKIYTQMSKTNIDNFDYWLAEDSNLLFYASEKSGWRQLYSIDLKTKKEQVITEGDYYVHDLIKIDEKNELIYYVAADKENDRNPYHRHLYSTSFKGRNTKLLTMEDKHHLVSFSPGGKYFADNYSTSQHNTITALRNAKTGEILKEMGKGNISGMENWSPPEVFTALGKDGITTIYGAMWKPTNFDPDKKYPIIDATYTGPHTQRFPKDFRSVVASSNQSIAELGFIVMVVDGLGSSGRSKAFHDYSYKNLGSNLEDHVGAIRQLGQRYSWIDTTKVGIFGHSAGGYDAAHALLAFPDFYKVAVASSADHDHRMEKAWWPEMYMGWPVDSAYHQQSNITMASNLKGKLLITHGGIDDNVNPSATFKLAEALIKADKQFDMLILPSQRHGYRNDHQKYFTKMRWNYFVEHLLCAQPIWDFEWEN